MRSVLIAILFFLQAMLIINDIHLPWHINILPICVLFLFVGKMLNTQNTLQAPIIAPVLALIIGSISIVINTAYFDLNHMIFGILPLAICGAIGVSYSLIYLCNHIINRNQLLELYGRNTLLIMGLHMLLSNILLLVISRIPSLAAWGYHWWFNAILILFLCIPLCLLWEKFRQRR